MAKYITRHMEETVKRLSQSYPVVMVCGQRQVGKSTMMYHIKEDKRKYVTLDDINARRLASNDPELFFETYGYPLIIDEFQRVPDLLLEIKKIVDQKALTGEENNGLFWLTGSQKFKMMKNVSETLAGRVAALDMSSLTASELEGRSAGRFSPELSDIKKHLEDVKVKTIHEIFESIFRGGMPKPITNDNIDRDRYYMDYVNTYLERDVKDLAQVGKIDEFYQFLVYMAANTAQEMKYEAISKEIGVSAPTVKNWVSILERSGIIYILHPYYAKATKRLVKTPKVYFMDTGLAAYLTRWPNADTLENGNAAGAFFETYVVTEILKSYMNLGIDPNLYYYRDIDRKEIDLLMVQGNTLYPIEIKKSKNPSDPDKNLKVLDKFKMEVKPMLILCMTNELIPYNRDAWLCPISVI